MPYFSMEKLTEKYHRVVDRLSDDVQNCFVKFGTLKELKRSMKRRSQGITMEDIQLCGAERSRKRQWSISIMSRTD